MNLRQLAHDLGGEVSGQQVLCPGPGHSPKDRSVWVRISPSAPDGLLVGTFSTKDEWHEAKDYVRSRLGFAAWRPDKGAKVSHPFVYDESRRLSVPAEQKLKNDTASDSSERIRRAVAIWDRAEDPHGSPVETYLKSRALELPWEAAGEAIRFHPACPWREEPQGLVSTTPKAIFVPAMVAAMRSIETGEITAIHRTQLTLDGQKVGRKMLGLVGGAAVMLCPYTAIGGSLAIGEGVETTLAGWQLGWSNAWALGSGGAIANFPLIVGLDTLVVFAETGAASARAVDQVGARYHDAGRQVVIVEPRFGSDLNDAIRKAAA